MKRLTRLRGIYYLTGENKLQVVPIIRDLPEHLVLSEAEVLASKLNKITSLKLASKESMDISTPGIQTGDKQHVNEIRKHVQTVIADIELEESDPNFEMKQIC